MAEAVKETCDKGDGTGGYEIHLGIAANMKDCLNKVRNQKPLANGATFKNCGGGSNSGCGNCFAEFCMNDSNDNENFESCLFETASTERLDNSDTEGSITDSCLGCIYEANTRYDVFTGCVANGVRCGPFLISKGYWIDSGRCVLEGDDPNDDQSFLRCANDLRCASRIVRSYSNAFAQDCNGDGLVTCDDYAMMYRNVGIECSNPLAI